MRQSFNPGKFLFVFLVIILMPAFPVQGRALAGEVAVSEGASSLQEAPPEILPGMEEEGKPRRRAGGSTSGEVGVPAESLTIMVGYYGGPYHTKKVFTLEELWLMSLVKQPYTFIDSMPAVVLNSAIGVRLTDILKEAGIDVHSVEAFHFYCSDVSASWYETMPKSYLLDTKRYYYPRLPTNWDYYTETALPGAKEDAREVEAILALEDNWQRFGLEPDFSDMDTSTRFRLVFGQADAAARTASRSAKWIHAVEVMLGGSPPSGVTLDKSALNLEVGSIFQLNAQVGIVDRTTDKRLQWESSDPSTVKVDSRGRIQVLKEGAATITVTAVVGGLSASCVVNGLPEEAPQTAVTLFFPPGNRAPEEENGIEDPSENPAENLEESGSEEKNTQTGGDYLEEVPEEKTELNLADSGNPGNSGDPEDPEAALQPWRVYEMSPTAVALPDIKEISSVYPYMWPGFLTFFCLGAITRYQKFRGEQKKVKKLRRI